MTRRSDHVGRMPIRLKNAIEDINRREQFERAVHRGATRLRCFRHDLLGGKGSLMPEHRIDHSPSRRGNAMTVLAEQARD